MPLAFCEFRWQTRLNVVYRKSFEFFCAQCLKNPLNNAILLVTTPFSTNHVSHYWHDFWWIPFLCSYQLKSAHRPSIKGTQQLFIVIKAIIIVGCRSQKGESWMCKGFCDLAKMWARKTPLMTTAIHPSNIIGDHPWSSFWFSNKQHYLSDED